MTKEEGRSQMSKILKVDPKTAKEDIFTQNKIYVNVKKKVLTFMK